MTRFNPWQSACLKANAVPDRVLPPPVGTVNEKSPGGISAADSHAVRISERIRLTGVSVAERCLSSSFAKNRSASVASGTAEGRNAARSGSINASVSRKSASTRHEYIIRIQNESELSSRLNLKGGDNGSLSHPAS